MKIPRKLKKEFRKISHIERTAAYVHPSVWVVKLKDGVKVNNWTIRLINIIYQERMRIERNIELAAKIKLERFINSGLF